MKKNNKKIFNHEIYSTPPEKIDSTYRLVYNHIDDILDIDLLDTSDYGILNN